MRRKASLLAAGVLAGATLSVTGGSPAQAQPPCYSNDPVLAYVCTTLGNVPEPGPWIQHYYDTVGEAVYNVYCKLWDPTC